MHRKWRGGGRFGGDHVCVLSPNEWAAASKSALDNKPQPHLVVEDQTAQTHARGAYEVHIISPNAKPSWPCTSSQCAEEYTDLDVPSLT
jgi:hypothetical protein